MFGELLESRAKPVRNRGGAVVSVIGHMLFIGLAVLATREWLNARGPEEERLVPLPVLPPTDQPRRPMPAAPRRTTATSRPDLPAAPPMQVPVIVPDHIPDIDLGAPSRTDIEWSTDERRAGIGLPANATGGMEDGIPFAPGVDKPALAHAGKPSPRYRTYSVAPR